MKIVVQKFGGTSVSTLERRQRIVEKVKNCLEEGNMPVVVVSAMGRKGEPYATDTLLSLVSADFTKDNLHATDLLMSCGEILSTVVMCDELKKANIEAMPLTGGQAGIRTDSNFANAGILNVNTENLEDLISKGIIPVIAGFQGQDKNGYITTLGRGGSDVTGALIGAALKAERVEIYTDVDGMMTTDPRVVPEASLIEKISYEEIFQFADQGTKVIHPRAVTIAQKYNIPLLIRNTMNDCEGTLISNVVDYADRPPVTGIACMNNRTQIRISYNSNENYFKILESLAENNISLDLINVFPKEKIFTIDSKDLSKLKEIFEELNLDCSVTEHCSKLSIIGSGMKGTPGVMAKILIALTRSNVEVLQTADSHMTIWCLIKEEDATKAIAAIHKEFKL